MNKDIKSIIQNIKDINIFDIDTTGTIIEDVVGSKTTIKITVPKISFDSIGRNLIITDSSLDNDGTYIIISQTDLVSTSVLTLNSSLITEDLGVPETTLTVLIQRDIPWETTLDNTLAVLNTSNDSILTSYDLTIKNSYFSNYEKLSETFINQLDSYKDSNDVSVYIKDINDFIAIEPDDFNKTQLDDYLIDLNSIISLIDGEQALILEYFERVKRLMIRLKITDLKIQEENYEDLFNTRSTEDQGKITDYYNYFLANDYDSWVDYKQELLYEIKIPV